MNQSLFRTFLLIASLLTSACSSLLPVSRITEISITQAGCVDECPRYSATLFEDGRLEYSGQSGAPFVGTWTAFVPKEDFMRLAELMQRERYFELDNVYGELGTHFGPVTTSAVRDGVRKTIVDHGFNRPAGPLALQWIEAAIEVVIRRGENWTQVDQ